MTGSNTERARLAISDLGPLLIRYAIYALALVCGSIIYFYLRDAGIVHRSVGAIVGFAEYTYLKLGLTAFGLIPLSLGLPILATMQAGYHLGWWQFSERHIAKYDLIEQISPVLGLLGTMLGMLSALRGLDVSKGLQTAIQHLSQSVGVSLYTSVLGLILAIIAYVMRLAYMASKKEAEA